MVDNKKIIENICKLTLERYKNSKTNDILTKLDEFKDDVFKQLLRKGVSSSVLDLRFDAVVSPYRQELKKNLEEFNSTPL